MKSGSIVARLVLGLALSAGAGRAQESPKPPTSAAPESKPKAATPSKGGKTAKAPKQAPKAKSQADPLAPDPETGLNPLIAAQVKAKRMEKAQAPKKPKGAPAGGYVDINSASKDELKTLKGMTDELAAKVIAGRPYPTKARLITNDVIPMSVYEPNKARIIAVQKTIK